MKAQLIDAIRWYQGQGHLPRLWSNSKVTLQKNGHFWGMGVSQTHLVVIALEYCVLFNHKILVRYIKFDIYVKIFLWSQIAGKIVIMFLRYMHVCASVLISPGQTSTILYGFQPDFTRMFSFTSRCAFLNHLFSQSLLKEPCNYSPS